MHNIIDPILNFHLSTFIFQLLSACRRSSDSGRGRAGIQRAGSQRFGLFGHLGGNFGKPGALG